MWDWISDVIGDVVETIGQTNWTDTLMDSVMPSIVGAGIGALATAVSGGDITEGLLYGAAGGLVSGGLASFGSQFSDNWSMASLANDPDFINTSSITGEMGGFIESDIAELDKLGITGSAETASKTSADVAKAGNAGKAWWDPSGFSEGGTQLLLGGASMLGNLLDDSPTETDLIERQLDTADVKYANRQTALANFSQASKDYTPTTSVRQVVSDQNVGFSKEDAGVNLG